MRGYAAMLVARQMRCVSITTCVAGLERRRVVVRVVQGMRLASMTSVANRLAMYVREPRAPAARRSMFVAMVFVAAEITFA